MSEAELPKDIADFIAKHIKSIEQLEVLILVSDSPETNWTIPALYQAIRSNPASIQERLQDLVRQELLAEVSEPSLAYSLKTDGKARTLVKRLKVIYRERPVRVIEAIYSSSRGQPGKVPGPAKRKN
jgi:hypothetical protein